MRRDQQANDYGTVVRNSDCNQKKTFRILSLDGGGIMGAFSAAVLATCEARCLKEHQKSLAEHFDLIAGTSTGGIIAIALGLGVSAQSILEFYQHEGSRIFPRTNGVGVWARRCYNLFGPKYSSQTLHRAIATVIGDQLLSASRPRLVIPAYDAGMGRVYLFKTPHHRHCQQDGQIKASDVAMATSAAPTYFPAHAIPGKGVFIDGGIWGNCPAVLGITEAVSFCGRQLEDIHVLSISTTNYPFHITKTQRLGGIMCWGNKIIDTFMFSQVQAAASTASSLLRDRDQEPPHDRFHRIDFIAQPKLYSLDKASAAKELRAWGQN